MPKLTEQQQSEYINNSIKKWKPLLCGMSYRFKNTICDYDDLYQEGILTIIESVSKFDPNKGKLNTFIFKCIKNGIKSAAIRNSFPLSVPSGSLRILKNHVTRENRVPYRSGPNNLQNKPDFYDKNFASVDIIDIVSVFDEQDMAYMHLINNYTYEEISEKVGISPSMVCRKVANIKNKIAEELIKCR